jgi:small subunit ribosomal protein S6
VNQYEVVALYHPDLEIDLDKASEKVVKIITDSNGKVANTDNWGKRKLAYSIKGVEYAIYVIYTVDLEAASVQKVESSLNITDEVIRFLITKIDHKAIAKAEAAKAKRASEHEEPEEAEPQEET